MVAVENMDMKDDRSWKKNLRKVPHVQDVLWYDDVADISLPTEMIPKRYQKSVYQWRCHDDAGIVR